MISIMIFSMLFAASVELEPTDLPEEWQAAAEGAPSNELVQVLDGDTVSELARVRTSLTCTIDGGKLRLVVDRFESAAMAGRAAMLWEVIVLGPDGLMAQDDWALTRNDLRDPRLTDGRGAAVQVAPAQWFLRYGSALARVEPAEDKAEPSAAKLLATLWLDYMLMVGEVPEGQGGAAPAGFHLPWSGSLASPEANVPVTIDYPRSGVIALGLRYQKPGTILDTVGINQARRGSFTMRLIGDGKLVWQVYDRGLKTKGDMGNGWQVVVTDPLEAGTWHEIYVVYGRLGTIIQADGTRYDSGELTTELSGEALYLGDFPGDEQFAGRYETHHGFVGELRELTIGPLPAVRER